jgi:hypothetical protein
MGEMVAGSGVCGNGGAIDESASQAYPCTVMKHLISRTFVLAALLAGTGSPVPAEDLDAALAAQKQKAQRRVYSDSALLENRNLEVPKTQTKDEEELDKKLREMEARLDREAAENPMQPQSRPATAVVPAAEDKNWLTPAMMDETASVSLTNALEEAWLKQELDRQKEKKAQEALVNENNQVEKLLREKTQLQPGLPEQSPLKKFQPAPSLNIIGSQNQNVPAPAYMTPKSGTPDPMAAIRLTPKKETSSAPPLFSPQAARAASALDNDPLRSSRSPSLTPSLGAPQRSSPFGYPSSSDDPEPVKLSPIEMIKKSSPINRADPFSDDHMPQINGSIWD